MQMQSDYGDLASFDGRTTVVFDVEHANNVLRDSSMRFEIERNFLGERLAPAQVAAVLQSRPLLNPGLRRASAERLQPLIRARTLQTFGAEAQASGAFDPLQAAEAVSSAMLPTLYFGKDAADDVAPAVANLLNLLETVIGNVFAMPAACRAPRQRRVERAHIRLHDLVSRLLDARSRRNLGDVASELLRRCPPQSRPGLPNLLIGSLLAGHRVPAAALAWVLMMVADDPELASRLRGEADQFETSITGGRIESPRAYPLALATVLETLRLYPPTWVLSRTSQRPVTLGRYHFPTGHTFVVSPYVMHRDDLLFEHAQVFDPQRWLTTSPPGQHYLAYGRGRHRCPGADLASTYLVVSLLTLVGRYTITRSGTVTPDPKVTLRPRGLRITLASAAC